MKNSVQGLINRQNMDEVRLSELENTNFRKLEKPRAKDLRNQQLQNFYNYGAMIKGMTYAQW